MPVPLFRRLILAALLLFPVVSATAQDPGDEAARARAVVADLMRIPGPDGIQETYKTPINGVEHWISIRGQDRANPVILFVHGGPASPLIPGLWQFQRPLRSTSPW